MAALQLHQTLVDAGMPSAAPRAYILGLCQRTGVQTSSGGGSLRSDFHSLLSALFQKAPALACSWLTDYLAFTTTLTSSDPEEADILQPQTVLAWCQQTTAGLQQRVGAFLQRGPSSGVDAVLEQQTAQALLAVARAVQAVSSTSNSDDMRRLLSTLQQLQHATKILQVLEQLQQQQMGSPGRPGAASATSAANGTPLGGLSFAAAAGVGGGFGQQPLLRANNASVAAWRQQIAARRSSSSSNSHLFLDDLLQQLQQAAGLRDGSAALAYPYPDVLTAIDALFASSGSGGGSSSSGGDSSVWHAKLAVLLYYLLDGGWLLSAEPFAQGFQLPLTMAQQWQCHYLLDAAAAAAPGATSALDKACHLLGAIACPTTPFRFVEALLQAGRPATALAVQRARCAGGGSASGSGSNSLNEAEVLLRVQLGCGLLSEAFCDLRRHCRQVPDGGRSLHTNKLMRQLTAWALSPVSATDPSAGAAAAAAAASSMKQQLQLQDGRGTSNGLPATAAAGLAGSSASKARQQQLLQLPLDAGEEAVLLAVLRERMAAGESGGHLAPLYLLQRGRTLEALTAYADYRTSPAAAGAGGAAQQPASDAEAAANRAMLHKRLDAVMAAAAAALPPALRAAAVSTTTSAAAAATAAGGGSDGIDSSSGRRSVLAGLGGSEVRRLGAEGGSLLLQQRGVEAPVFLAPLLQAAGSGAAVAALGGAPTPSATAGGRRGMFAAAAAAAASRAAQPGGAARGVAGNGGRRQQASAAGQEGGVSGASRPLLFEREVLAEAGPGTVNVGARDAAVQDAAADVVPLLFGTPAPSATAPKTTAAAAVGGGGGAAAAGKTPGIVRGGLFDTPVGMPPGAGGVFWGKQATPATGAAAAAAGFAGMSEADFERQVRFATPQPKAAAAGAGAGGGGGAAGGGVFSYTGQRSHKRMRKTPI